MSKLNSLLRLSYLLIAIIFMTTACGDDDEMTPSSGDITAAFTFSIEQGTNLVVNFTNTSTGATNYVWDFGDGNTSSSENPVHTYAEEGTYTVKLSVTADTKSDETTQSVTVSSSKKYHDSGYYITSVTTSSAGTSYFGGYFPDMPSGNIDLTTKQSFPFMFFRDRMGPFLFGQPSDGISNGVVKYAVDINTNQLVEVETINTIDAPSIITIIDEQLGFYGNFQQLIVTAFNPTTMENIQTIDLSANTPVNTDFEHGIAGLFYNAQTGKIIAPLFVNDPNSGPFYDDVNVYAEVIDVATLTREKTITHPNAAYPIFRGERNVVIDESGNLYLIAQGSYGLDGQVGPTAPNSSVPLILKIDTNSEFDTDYAWNPIDAVSLQTNFIKIFVSMIYAGNGKGYGIGTGGPESPQILQLLQLLATGQITQEQSDELQFLVFADESNKYISFDLISKTAEFVNTSFTAGFAYPFLYDYDDTIYAQNTSEGGTFNGYYTIDKNSNAASASFNITAGGVAGQIYKLEE